MAKKTLLQGNVWLIQDEKGNYIDNIDTDMIYHNAHLAITDISKMGQHTFGNLSGWEDFPQKVKQNDIIFVGANFGAGSSRQQAVDCFSILGITCIVAESYGAIYKRNAINSGMPILICPNLKKLSLKNENLISVNLETGELKNKDNNTIANCSPLSKVQMDIYQSGDLFTYAKNM